MADGDAQGDAQPPGEEQPHAGTASGGAAAAAPPGQPLPADDEQGGFEELDAGLDEYEDDEQVGFEEVDVVLDGYEQDADVDAHVRFEEVDAGLDGYDYDGADEEHAVFVDAEHGFELGGDEEDLDWDLNEDEEDMEEEGDWMWGEGGESESSYEQDDELEAVEGLAEETAGRHVCGGHAAYAVPTIAHHFQSADALSVAELPPSAAHPGGGLLAATFDSEGVAAWLLPPAGAVTALGAGSQPGAVRLGGFQAPRDLYSMALSPDARWIATGGEGGLLCLYEVDAAAPPRPPPPTSKPVLTGLNYLYTPVVQQGHVDRVLQVHRQRLAASQAAMAAGGSAPPLLPGLPPELEHVSPELVEIVLTQTLAQAMRADFGDLSVENALQHLQQVQQGVEEEMQRRGLPPGTAMGDLPPEAPGQEQEQEGLQRLRAAREQLEELNLQMRSQKLRNAAAAAAHGFGTEGAAGDDKGKAPAAGTTPEQQQQQQQQQGGQAPAAGAAVMLRGIFSLGLEPAQAKHVPFLSDGMTNGVRWGLMAGRTRLLAADQSQYVYCFELPSASVPDAPSSSSGAGPSGSGGGVNLRPEQLLCGGLGEPSSHWRMRPVNFFRTEQHSLGARVSQQHPPPDAAADEQPPGPPEQQPVRRSQRAAAVAASAAWAPLTPRPPPGSPFLTAAIGPFPVPCNLAAASPDGRWVAVVGDSQAVFVCDQQAGFAWRQLPYDLAGSREGVEENLEAGSQYVTWNASSTLLALTSDALHAIFVFEPASGRMVLRVEGHRRPCLCVGFAPWDDRLLAYAEECKCLHLRRVPAGAAGAGGEPPACVDLNAVDDLAEARPGVQLLRLPVVQMPAAVAPAVAAGMGGRRRRVTGMALTRQGDLLVTTARQGSLVRFFSSGGWAPERHAAWPAPFRAVVQTLLLCAHRQQAAAGAGAPAGLWLLPLPLLQLIVALAAGKRTDWMLQAAEPAGAAAAAAAVGPDEGGGGSST